MNPLTPHLAYTRLRRLKNLFWFIRNRAGAGAAELERTQSRHVGPTYGLDVELVKRVKARFRNELSFGSEGK